MKRVVVWIAMLLCLLLCACGKQTDPVQRESADATAGQTELVEVPKEQSPWTRFRDYLRENGDAVVEKDMSTAADYIAQKTVIKGKESDIVIRFEVHTRSSVGESIGSGNVFAQMRLAENAQEAEVEIQWEVSGVEGSKQMIMSYDAVYLWDITSYEEGDKVVFITDYTHADEAGNSLKQDENSVLEADISGILSPVADALRKALAESGLGITMADLGFVNY